MAKKKPLALQTIGRTCWDMVDYDYEAKLTAEEHDFLRKFTKEYYRASFLNNESDLHPEKTEVRRRIYGANNERNRDVWNEFDRLPYDLQEYLRDEEGDE